MSANVPALDAAIRILESLASERPRPVSPGTLVAELGLNRSTCYSILAALQHAGWATPAERAGWTLGPRLLRLTGVSQEHVVGIAQEELDALSRRLRLVAFAAERDGSGRFTVVAKGECATGTRVTIDVGARLPCDASAVFQAFAAWLPEDQPAGIGRQGPGADPDGLRTLLSQVRGDGFSRGARHRGPPQGIAAATVFDTRSRATLAVSVLAFSDDPESEQVARVGTLVRDTADRITARIGGVPPERYRETHP